MRWEVWVLASACWHSYLWCYKTGQTASRMWENKSTAAPLIICPRRDCWGLQSCEHVFVLLPLLDSPLFLMQSNEILNTSTLIDTDQKSKQTCRCTRVWSAAIFPSAFEESENMSDATPTLKLHAIIQWMGHSLIPVTHWKNADFNLIMDIFHHNLLHLYKLNCCIYWNLVKWHLIGTFLNDSLF